MCNPEQKKRRYEEMWRNRLVGRMVLLVAIDGAHLLTWHSLGAAPHPFFKPPPGFAPPHHPPFNPLLFHFSHPLFFLLHMRGLSPSFKLIVLQFFMNILQPFGASHAQKQESLRFCFLRTEIRIPAFGEKSGCFFRISGLSFLRNLSTNGPLRSTDIEHMAQRPSIAQHHGLKCRLDPGVLIHAVTSALLSPTVSPPCPLPSPFRCSFGGWRFPMKQR